jgi:flagellar hook-basal body protein
MGLSGARNSAVTGLQAQSTDISISADNIANASTPGYKAIKGQFSTLVTSSGSSNGYSSGGVAIRAQTLVEQQGLINSTGRVTDLAISGNGFFAVQDDSGNLLLSRAGSFDINNKGELVNTSGYKLLGWPLDNDGRKPGAIGNLNTTAAESTGSLVVVDTNSASGTAAATTTIKVGMNLNAGQTTYQGATVTLTPSSTDNNSISQSDIIVPVAGMQQGDAISFTSNNLTTTFTYGGFARSADLADTPVFGSTLTQTIFTAGSSLVDGDQFTVSTTSSGTATFTFKESAPDTSQGEFNSLDSLATAMNTTTGLTARTDGTALYVSSDVATESITFADVAGSNLDEELGFSNVSAATAGVNRYNTIVGLQTLISNTDQLGSVINNASSGANIEIFSKDPLLPLTTTKIYNAGTIDLKSDNNGNLTQAGLIVPVEGSDMTIGTSSVSFTDGTNTGTFVYGGIANSTAISAGMFGVTTSSAVWPVGANLSDADTIVFTDSTGPVGTYRYKTTPLVATDFNSLDTLATAINADGKFIARVDNDKLYVSAVSGATSGIAITNPVSTGAGIKATLGLVNVAAAANRFATLSQLNALVAGITNFDTTLTTGANANIAFSTTDGSQITIGGASNIDLLSELGISSGAIGDGFFSEMSIDGVVAAGAQSAVVSVTYDPSDSTKNMAGGNVTPHFPRNIQIFDALGTGHNFRLSFLKTGSNTWAVELYSLNPTEIVGRSDGQVASGTVEFNGDGTLKSISTSLANNITIPWTTGATNNTLAFNLGTAGEPSGTVGATSIGLTDGLRQFDSSYNVEFIEQNGVAAGQFKGITVAEDGTISANFSNGEIKPIYKLPIMTVANQNALSSKTGNVFVVTQASGEVNLKDAGSGGAGVVVPGALEGSTSDIAEELTKTIGIQSNYNANATLISTIKAMEEELNRRL